MNTADLKKMISQGGHVTIPAGTYTGIEKITVPKGAILDGKGKVTFDGAREVTDWKSRSGLKRTRYTPIPIEDGHGITFTTGQNLSDPRGKYADQAWLKKKSTPLKRVIDVSKVVPGTFTVSNGWLYVHPTDAAGGVLVSDARVFGTIEGEVRGVTIKRYSPTAKDRAAVRLDGGALKNSTVAHSSFVAVSATGSGPKIVRCTISRCGWMGISAVLADNLILDRTVIRGVNPYGWFTSSPQSGALKTSRVRTAKLTKVKVKNTKGHGLWFDQSNLDVSVDNCNVSASGCGVFFEISHGLTLTNSTIKGSQAVKIAGASGVRIRNNTLVGDKDTVGIYTDKRSLPNASKPGTKLVPGSYASDRLPAKSWDRRLTWCPEVLEFSGNTISMPTKTGYCGKPTKVCVLTRNGSARVPMSKINPNSIKEIR